MKIRVWIYEEVIMTGKFPVIYGQQFVPGLELLLSWMIVFHRHFNHFLLSHDSVPPSWIILWEKMIGVSVLFYNLLVISPFLSLLFLPSVFCIPTHSFHSVMVYWAFCFLFPNSILLMVSLHRTCSYHCILNVTDFSFTLCVRILPNVLLSDNSCTAWCS